MSNTPPVDQNRPSEVSDPAHRMALQLVKMSKTTFHGMLQQQAAFESLSVNHTMRV